MNISDWLGANTVYLVLSGSHAYGTSTPESDFDYRGATVPPKNYFFGLDRFEQSESKEAIQLIRTAKPIELPDDSDITIWSLSKMIQLASDGNPNVRREV